MLSLVLSSVILSIVFACPIAHAFVPYARQFRNITEPTTPIELSSTGASTVIGTAVSSSHSVFLFLTSTIASSPVSVGTSNPTTSDLTSTETFSPISTGTSRDIKSSTAASIVPVTSGSHNSSSLPSTTASSAISRSSGTSLGSSDTRLSPASTGLSVVTSSSKSGNVGGTSDAPSHTSTGAAIVPSIVLATDGSGRSTTITWSAVETGSTSTTDNNGQPTVIPAPFFVCNSPLCKNTGCILAILCSKGGGAARFNGFPPPIPPPIPPPGPPADIGNDSPTGSASQSVGSTTSSTSRSSVSTTTSTSHSSSSGTGTPITTVTDPGPSSAGEPDDSSLRRVRRTLGSRDLVARGRPRIDTIGTCRLTNPVTIPLYLGYGQAMKLKDQPNGNGGANKKIYDTIEKWYAENLAFDGTPFTGAKLDNMFGPNLGRGSIDHVWEKSNVGDFLASLLGSGFDCDDMNRLFSPCGAKLQKIFDQLASMETMNLQTGFAAMNQNLNGMKGWMFSQGFASPTFGFIYKTDDAVIQALQRQAIIFNWFNSDTGIQSLHDETNNRIYGAFVALDDFISKNKIQRANGRGDLTQRFGPSFRTWYSQLLTRTGSATYTWANNQVTRLDADMSLEEDTRRAINAFQSNPLYSEDKFQIDQSHLSWKATSVPLRRSLLFERDDTCTLSASVSPSATSISTQSSLTESIPSSSIPPSTPSPSIILATSVTPSSTPPTSTPTAAAKVPNEQDENKKLDALRGGGVPDLFGVAADSNILSGGADVPDGAIGGTCDIVALDGIGCTET